MFKKITDLKIGNIIKIVNCWQSYACNKRMKVISIKDNTYTFEILEQLNDYWTIGKRISTDDTEKANFIIAVEKKNHFPKWF